MRATETGDGAMLVRCFLEKSEKREKGPDG